MKNIITALSGLIAMIVFVYCMWIGADIETILWKTVLTFIATNLITFAAFGVTSVAMNLNEKETKVEEEEDDDDDLLRQMETSGSEANPEAAVNA